MEYVYSGRVHPSSTLVQVSGRRMNLVVVELGLEVIIDFDIVQSDL